MGDRERRVAALLMQADSLSRAEYVLFTHAPGIDLAELVREMQAGRHAFERDGQAMAAALVDFHMSLVEEIAPALREADRRRGAESAGSWERVEREARGLLAQGHLDAALELVRSSGAALPPDSYATGRMLGMEWQIAEAMGAAGRHREALRILDGLDQEVGTSDDVIQPGLRLRLHRMRGGLYQAEGEYGRACSEYRAALDAASSIGEIGDELQIRAELADAHSAAGRSRLAVRECRRILTRAEAVGAGPEPRALALNLLGNAYRRAGDAAAARRSFRGALELAADAGVDDPRVLRAAESWVGLGDLLVDEDDHAGAAEAYFQGLLKSMTVNREATAHGMRLVVSRMERLRAPEAALLLRTAGVFRDSFPADDRYWGHHLPFRLAEAEASAASGDPVGAAAALRGLREEALGRRADLATLLRLETRLARTLRAAGRSRSGTCADRQAAFDLLWARRCDLRRTVAGRAGEAREDLGALVARHQECYGLLIDMLLDDAEGLALPEGDGAVELAFDLHEEYRAWVEGASAPAGVPGTPATLCQLRACLAADPDARRCAFVSYFFYGESGDQGSCVIFVVHADTGRLTAFRTAVGQREVQRAAGRLRQAFDGDADAFPPLPPLPARRPWRRKLDFFEGLAPGLLAFLPAVDGRELLCIAADPAMQALPLAALPLPPADGNGRKSRPLLAHHHAVVHVSSATSLQRTVALPSAPVGAGVLVAGVAAGEDPAPERLEHDIDFIAPLVTSQYGGRQALTEISRLSATPDAVLAGLCAARVAHLTGHGWFDRAEPLDSGLLLAHDGQRPSKYPSEVEIRTRLRHLLTARHALDAGLRLDLITLRACSTARRDLHSTGDLQGLAHLLQSSGVRSVVGTLWDVDDTSSRRLFADFYRRLSATPETPWRALWEAQRAMLEGDGTQRDAPWQRHPYHWAALALFGDWRIR
ncbi:CHAT domain-containing protein [Streptomyces oryzae]|uniref:CHAT domain-containing protein n=1 Tax=Streptomyces oryzae TaxID=1434886 RepID=A0ABS3XL70_9ACTN|nr:CHAT domain-containing protein [Streptomyces oryzae]MBO8196157.1 CHAT domain-containing protein [Streptomyces oryzae]